VNEQPALAGAARRKHGLDRGELIGAKAGEKAGEKTRETAAGSAGGQRGCHTFTFGFAGERLR
jgi:hypothetical protein